MTKWIGISGKAGTGKDWLAHHVFRPLGFQRLALADMLKASAAGFGFSVEDIRTKPPAMREWLQEYGVQMREQTGGQFWLRQLAYLAEEVLRLDRVVVPDVRFPNEVDFIRDRGGAVVRLEQVDRQHNPTRDTQAEHHISETALDGPEHDRRFDLILPADRAPLGLWRARIEPLLEARGLQDVPLPDPFILNRFTRTE